MRLFMLIFLWLIALYQPLSTLFIHGLWSISSMYLALIRDAIRAGIILYSFFRYRRYIWSYVRCMWSWWIWWILIVLWWILVSLYNAYFEVSWLMTWYRMEHIWSLLLLWFKYWLLYRWVCLSATWLGYICAHEWKQWDWRKLWYQYWYIVMSVIVGWVLRQAAKMFFPSLFDWWWYGSLSDFSASNRPPLYYLTAYEWFPRLSGLFSGPNEYWYVLMTLFGFLMYWIMSYVKLQRVRWTYIVTYIVSLLATISRWALIGVWAQLIWRYGRSYRQRVVVWVVVGLWWIIAMSIWKPASTHTHLMSKVWNSIAIMNQPMWYWFGISGPSIHYNGCVVCLNAQQCSLQPWGICPYCDCFLPENIYMQLMLELWVLWFMLWFAMTCSRLMYMYRLLYVTWDSTDQNILIGRLLFAGFVWLLVEWLFLHVFESALVNYLFFVPLGIVWWYLLKQDNIRDIKEDVGDRVIS